MSMQCMRLSETISNSYRQVREASCLLDRQYDIPLSRLLQFERYRGLATTSCSQRRHQSRRAFHAFNGGLCDGESAANRVLLDRPEVHVRRTRGFSSCAINKRLSSSTSLSQRASLSRPPGRAGPPIPPSARRALGPLKPKAATPSEDDDILYAPIPTSEERDEEERKRRLEQLVSNRANEIWMQKWQRIQDLEVRYNASQKVSFSTVAQELREAQEKGHADLAAYLDRIWRLHAKSQSGLHDLKSQIQPSLEDARLRGRRDKEQYDILQAQTKVWESYREAHLGAYIRSVERSTEVVSNLRRQVAELAYTIDWKIWRSEQLDLQASEVATLRHDLKGAEGDHVTITDLMLSYTSVCEELTSDLEDVVRSPDTQYHRLRLKTPLIRSCLQIREDQKRLAIIGHNWRKANRLNQIGLRLPELTAHSHVDLRTDKLLTAIHTKNADIIVCSRYLVHLSKLRGRTHAQKAYENYFATMLDTWFASTQRVHSDLQSFMPEGMFLSNRATSSKIGKQNYAIMFPMYAYVTAMNSTLAVTEKIKDREQAMRDAAGLQQAPAWENLYKKIYEVHESWRTSHLRSNHDLFFELQAGVIPKSLKYESKPFPAKWLERKRAQCERQSLEQQALSRALSRRDQTEATCRSAHDAFSNLYPMANNIKVEYIISRQRGRQVLEELLACKVLGVELVVPGRHSYRHADLQYVLLATIDRIVILENHDFARGTPRNNLLQELLEDPSIVKVVSNYESLRPILRDISVFPQGVVDLGTMHDTATRHRGGGGGSRGTRSRRGLCLRTPVNIHLFSSADRSMFKVFYQLALLPFENLSTFLNAIDIRSLSNLSHDLRINILEGRERLGSKEQDMTQGSWSFGPIQWEKDPCVLTRSWPKLYIERFGSHKNAPADLPNFVQALAHNEMKNIALQPKMISAMTAEELKSTQTENKLAAYYLLTTFDRDLSEIPQLLQLDRPAEGISWIVDKLRLPLTDAHRRSLHELAGIPLAIPQPQPTGTDHDTSVSVLGSLKAWLTGVIPSAEGDASDKSPPIGRDGSSASTEGITLAMPNKTTSPFNGSLATSEESMQGEPKHDDNEKTRNITSLPGNNSFRPVVLGQRMKEDRSQDAKSANQSRSQHSKEIVNSVVRIRKCSKRPPLPGAKAKTKKFSVSIKRSRMAHGNSP